MCRILWFTSLWVTDSGEVSLSPMTGVLPQQTQAFLGRRVPIPNSLSNMVTEGNQAPLQQLGAQSNSVDPAASDPSSEGTQNRGAIRHCFFGMAVETQVLKVRGISESVLQTFLKARKAFSRKHFPLDIIILVQGNGVNWN